MAMAGEVANLLTPAPEGIKMLGPAEAPVSKLKSEYRYQLLLKAASPQGPERACYNACGVLRWIKNGDLPLS